MNQEEINQINQNLEKINSRLGNSWLAFLKGLLYGFGSVLGAGLAIILIGWFLNAIGIIPAFQKQAEQWRQVFIGVQQSKSILPSNNN